MSTAAVPVTPRACPECVAHDEDPAPWCDCEADGTTYCAGPCRNRAHDPDQCPRVGVTPGSTTAEDDVNDLAAANDALRQELAHLHEKLDAAEARRDDLARRILRMKEEAAAAHTDCHTPIPLRWRHVRPGDVVVLKDKLWEVVGTNTQDVVTVIRGGKTHSAAPDADATVPVLVRHQEREALQIAREQLGGTVMDRRV